METEAFPIRFTKGIRSYWRRHNYKHVDGHGGGTRGHQQLVRLGGSEDDGPMRHWGVHLGGRVKTPAPAAVAVAAAKAPARVLGRIRDAYVDAMLGAAKSRPVAATAQPGAPEALWQKRVPVRRARTQPRQRPDEFGQRLVEEIYKSVVASRSVSEMLSASVKR